VRVRDGLGIGRGLGGGRSIELHDSIDMSKRHAAKKVHFPGTETPPLVVYSSRKPDDTRS
jgi:hypothetical protein